MAIERLAEAHPIMQKIFSNILFKVWIAAAFAVLFDPSKGAEMTAVFILIMIDFLTGVGAAKYVNEQIKSAKIFRSGVKVLTYFGMISAGYLLETSIGYNVGADEILIAFLAATEFISIMENMGKLGFKTPKKLLNVVEDIQKGRLGK